MRKRGGLPQHPGDGTRIAEVSTCEFEDRRVKPGETVSYAVLGQARRGRVAGRRRGGPGALPARRPGCPRRATRRGEVELSWIPPAWSLRGPRRPQARVLRRPAPATAIGSRSSLDQAFDRRPREDQVYHYGIYAIYRTPDGQPLPFAGSRGRGDPAVAVPRPFGPPG